MIVAYWLSLIATLRNKRFLCQVEELGTKLSTVKRKIQFTFSQAKQVAKRARYNIESFKMTFGKLT